MKKLYLKVRYWLLVFFMPRKFNATYSLMIDKAIKDLEDHCGN